MYQLRIGHLYPDLLNLYGDQGNLTILKKRMEWRGHQVSLTTLPFGTSFDPADFDLLFLGGGQDSAMHYLLPDFLAQKAAPLKEAIETDTTVLAICGGYQLLGHSYQAQTQETYEFAHILDFTTKSSTPRCKGDLIFQRPNGTLIAGYENHSGYTFLGEGLSPLGTVRHGYGNNGIDHQEGLHYKNTFGTYCHGPLLALNPEFADELLSTALLRKYGEALLTPLKDDLEQEAKAHLLRRRGLF